jgi:transposase
MKLHANARLSVKGRGLLIDRIVGQGWSLTQAAEAAGVSDRTAFKWVARFRGEGEQGLLDRSSAPKASPTRTPDERVQVIAALRRLRMTGAEIAECLDIALTTVSGILTKIGMGKLGRLGIEPAVRYQRSAPGELIHVDVKKLGRISRPGWRVTGGRKSRGVAGYHDKAHQLGWEFVHVCVDDCTRLAYVEVLDDEKATTAIGFLRRAIAFYASHGVIVREPSQIMAPRTAPRFTRSRVTPWESATCALVPTAPRPTGRQSASSAPCSAAGPTERSTATAQSAPQPYPAGSSDTTGDDHTAPSTTSHPELASTS